MPAEVLDATRTAERRELLIRLLETRVALNPTHVARQVGVNERTMRRWLAEDKDFARRVEEATEQARLNAVNSYENKASSLALDGDSQLLKFLLAAHKPDRYRPEPKQLTNNGTVINIGALTIIPTQAPGELPAAIDVTPDVDNK